MKPISLLGIGQEYQTLHQMTNDLETNEDVE